MHDAALELSSDDPPTTNQAKAKQTVAQKPLKTRSWTVAVTGRDAHDCIHFKHGEPSSKWAYRNPEGELIGYVARYDTVDGRMQYCPWTPNGNLWQPKKWTGIQPLFGMDILAQRPNDTVLICEGENAADAARKICGEDYVCITWPGGAEVTPNASIPGQRNAQTSAGQLQAFRLEQCLEHQQGAGQKLLCPAMEPSRAPKRKRRASMRWCSAGAG